MATVKMTFSLDELTARRLNQTAERLNLAKSEIVREAIHDYAARAGRLSENERQRLLRAFDEHLPQIPDRPVEAVEQELEDLHRARRGGGRQSQRDHESP